MVNRYVFIFIFYNCFPNFLISLLVGTFLFGNWGSSLGEDMSKVVCSLIGGVLDLICEHWHRVDVFIFV